MARAVSMALAVPLGLYSRLLVGKSSPRLAAIAYALDKATQCCFAQAIDFLSYRTKLLAARYLPK